MLTIEQATNRAADLVARAIRAGADAADSVYAARMSTDVQMRLGALEDVQRSEGEEIGLRVFVGRRSASAASSDLSSAALAAIAERVVAMAREAPEDQFAGLAPEDRLMRDDLPALDLDDPAEVSPAELRARALAAEDAARAVPGIINSDGAAASHGRAVRALATSHGFAAGYQRSSHGISASMVAGDDAGMETDYYASSARYLSDVEAAESVGREAGERAAARLQSQRLKSGPMPVIFDRRVSASLLGHLAGAITGSSIARKTSFLREKLGMRLFDSAVQVIDDPLRLRGLGSRAFDGEGLPTAQSRLIADGVLTGWLIDSASGRQLGLAPTGHASRGVSGPPGVSVSNLYMANGDATPEALMADIKTGLYVTSLIGDGVNGLTGDYSRGASGLLISDGALGPAVSEVTIAGNLIDMFASLIPANDLEFRNSVNAPTLRIDTMMLAGE